MANSQQKSCEFHDDDETMVCHDEDQQTGSLLPDADVRPPRKGFTLESSKLLDLILFVNSFHYSLIKNSESNLILDRACEIGLNRTYEECNGNDTKITDESQIIASNFHLFYKLITLIPPAIILIFVGAWSDRYGKKPLLVSSVIGSTITQFAMIWYVTSVGAPLYWILVLNIPKAVTGGYVIVPASVRGLASQNSSLRSRTTKYALIQFATMISNPLGTFLGGLLYDRFGYLPAYILSFACMCVALACTGFVKDPSEVIEASCTTKFKDFFSCEGIKENFKVTIKKRENKGRAELWLLLMSLFILHTSYGEFEMTFLYTKKMFRWSLPYYSDQEAIRSISSAIFMIIAIPLLTNVFNISEYWIAVIGIFSSISRFLIQAFAGEPWMFFLGSGFGLFSTTTQVAIYSRLSKIGEKCEQGKIFAFASVLETFPPLLGTLIETEIYNATIDYFPGLFLISSACIMVIPLLSLMWIIRFTKPTSNQDSQQRVADQNSEPHLTATTE